MRNMTVGKVISRIFFALLFIVLGYLFWQIRVITNPNYTYETVIEYSYTDSISAEGYVLFEETLVEGSGNLGYFVEEGERVSKGQAVAEYYTSDTQRTLRAQLEQINAEIALLKNSENTAGALIDTLVSQRNTAVYALLTQLDQAHYDAQPEEAAFLLAQNKLQVTTGDVVDFAPRIESLTAQAQSYTETLGSLESVIAPRNGYFVSKNAAQVLPYTKDDLLAMPIAAFANTLEAEQRQSTEHIAGKVVSSYTWYFVGACSAEERDRFAVGRSLTLAFPEKTDTLFPAKVVSVEEDDDSDCLRVTLSCEYIGADVLALGQENAQIIFKTYEGLRVPLDAVRMRAQEMAQPSEEEGDASAALGEEYVKGIYVAYNGLAKFRKIEILYQTDDYILVPFYGESDVSTVRLYDQVIISGVDLSDGKLL